MLDKCSEIVVHATAELQDPLDSPVSMVLKESTANVELLASQERRHSEVMLEEPPSENNAHAIPRLDLQAPVDHQEMTADPDLMVCQETQAALEAKEAKDQEDHQEMPEAQDELETKEPPVPCHQAPLDLEEIRALLDDQDLMEAQDSVAPMETQEETATPGSKESVELPVVQVPPATQVALVKMATLASMVVVTIAQYQDCPLDIRKTSVISF